MRRWNRRWLPSSFGIKGVSGVFLGHDFVTVSRKDTEWQQLKPAMLGAIMDHYMSGAPMLAGAAHCRHRRRIFR